MPLNTPALYQSIYAAFRKQSIKPGPNKGGVEMQLARDLSMAIYAYVQSGPVVMTWFGGIGTIMRQGASHGPAPSFPYTGATPDKPFIGVVPPAPASTGGGGGGGNFGSSGGGQSYSPVSVPPSDSETESLKSNEDVAEEPVPSEATDGTLTVVIGGISYATSDWMLSQMPDNLKQNRTIIKYEHNDNYRTIISKINSVTHDKLELTGFSGGGNNIFKMLNAGVKPDFLGLIDPSVPSGYDQIGHNSQKNMPAGSNTVFYFNHRNWGTTGNVGAIRKRLIALKPIMQARGFNVNEESTSHKKMPSEFYKRYMI